MYFYRLNPKGVIEKSVNDDVLFGEILPDHLDTYRAVVTNVFLPCLQQQENWGKCEDTREYLRSADRFANTLNEAVNSLHGGVELDKPDAEYVTKIPLQKAALDKASADDAVLAYFDGILGKWCKEVERVLREVEKEQGSAVPSDSDNSGPDTELEFWRTRMAKFNSITEQLTGRECKLVLGVCGNARTKNHRVWKELDIAVTDAANEAKDNVKYLMTLEKSMEPMYSGADLAEIVAGLPVLMNNIKMMHTIARYYNTTECMTKLFCKITNQMITKCKEQVRLHAAQTQMSSLEVH